MLLCVTDLDGGGWHILCMINIRGCSLLLLSLGAKLFDAYENETQD